MGSIKHTPIFGIGKMGPTTVTTSTIASGVLTISSTEHLVAGEGGNDDTVTSFVVPASFIGKWITLRRTGGDAITFQAAAIQRAIKVILNHDDDCLVVEVTAADTVKVISMETAGG